MAEPRVPLSAIVLTKNEEANICACLESLTFASEIIVVDSGSTDRTVELAKRYTERVYIRDWPSWAEQRNYAATLASHDWILAVDADERVTAELAEEIRQRLPDSVAAAYRNTIKEYMFGGWVNHGGWEKPNYVRLYRKDRTTFGGAVHERPYVDGAIEILGGEMHHFSHLTVNDFMGKMALYTEIEARDRLEKGWKAHLWRVIPRFFWTFVGRFIYRRGWKDGARGFTIAFLMAVYYSLEEIKLWELRNSREVSANLSADPTTEGSPPANPA